MVGPPKSLTDLRRIEAAVQLTCTVCRHRWVRDREDLVGELLRARKSLDWQSLPGQLKCESCSKGPVRVLALPFTPAPDRAVASPAEMVRVNLALTVLLQAAAESTQGKVGTPAVRLALRVVAPYVRDTNLLTEFWREATAEPRAPWTSCNLPYRWIVQRLIDRGYPVWAEVRSQARGRSIR